MVRETAQPKSSEVAGAFARGDDTVVSAYFRANAGLLLAMARRFAPPSLDPEDLLSEAVTSLLSQWSKGTGPQDHINAYLVQSMRNRAKDELKSPRSRTYALELVEESPAQPSPLLDRAELNNEITLLRKALARLPSDHQTVLRETIVNGRKPAELRNVLNRPASAITALTVRAKRGLRRAMLQVLISEGTDECRKAVRHVPNPVPQELVTIDARGRPTHFSSCAHCRRSWARFAALPSALGLTVLLVLGDVLGGDAHVASASAVSSAEPSSRRRSRRRNALLLSVGLVALTAAAIATLFPFYVQTSGPDASVEVIREPLGDAKVAYSIRLQIEAEAWHPQQATFAGPQAISTIEPPPGWTCTVTDTQAVCDAAADISELEDFVVLYVGDVAVPAFELQVVAVTSDGATVTTDAAGAGID